MLFSQTSEYALRAVLWLARNADQGTVGVGRIAEETQVPQSYLSKVLGSLTRSGIVGSRRGINGGFHLLSDPCELTVLDVVMAIDPITQFDDCPLKLPSHKERRCPMHAKMNSAIAKVKEVLQESTIDDLLRDTSRPAPLLDIEYRAED